MKLNIIKNIAFCMGLLLAVGCTNNFDEINPSATGITQAQYEQDYNNIKGSFNPLFNNIMQFNPAWGYQIQQGLQGDLWSGYMATPTAFAGGKNNSTYFLMNGWNGNAWDVAYNQIMANAKSVKTQAQGKFDQFYSLALILKVAGMHRITDTYGPIVYSKYGTLNPKVDYDSQEEVYNQMFKELDTAVTDLNTRISKGEKTTFADTDLSDYGGDYKKWVKYANSLRLRLAMRLSKVNSTLAKTQAEKAVAAGVISSNDEIFKVKSAIYTHPIATISNDWEDIRMSADMESILGGYNDPRISVYFNPATKDSLNIKGTYKGVRTGIKIKAKASRTGFSAIGPIVTRKEMVLMNYAEVCFLQAEGALRGWNMGKTAQFFYEAGITASFAQHGASGASTYIADNTKTAKDYVDPVDPTNNATAVNNVTIAWDAAASNEVKLQKIITQKWIAGFTDGQEAWSEWRRTGYPKLFPVLENYSSGTITTELGVRRVNFVQGEKDGNPLGLATGLAKLGGPDNGGTRLWWDTTGSNF